MIKTLLKFYILFTLLLTGNMLYPQKGVNLNKGGTKQKHYYTVIPYKEVKSKVIVQCSINGKPYNFFVDTGAAMSITPKVFKELQPDIIGTVLMNDQAGIVDSIQVANLNNITLGNVTFSNIPTAVVKDSEIFECFGVDGLIGSNLLRNSIIQFSAQTHTVIITDDSKRLNLKRKYASRMELSTVQSNPFIRIEAINGNTTATDNLLFDSGMEGFYDLNINSFHQAAGHLQLFTVLSKAKGSYTWGLNGLPLAQDYYKVSVPQLKINNATFKNVIIETTYGNSSRIGAGLFDYGLVTLDYKNKKFYFEPYATTNYDLQTKDWPFAPTLKDGKLVVGIVWGEIWRQVIIPGDEIVEFNGKVYKDADFCSIITSSNKTANTRAKLVLKDATTGEIKEIEVYKE